MDSPRKGLPGKTNSRCKGPEVGRSLRNGKGHVSERSHQLRLEKLTAARSRRALMAAEGVWSFSQELREDVRGR